MSIEHDVMRAMGKDAYDDWCLRRQCEFGTHEFRAGKCKGVLFKVFNGREADIVRAEMAKYPDVRYGIDRIC